VAIGGINTTPRQRVVEHLHAIYRLSAYSAHRDNRTHIRIVSGHV
jgi:hypothetical protein